MNRLSFAGLAGLAGLASLGAQAQSLPFQPSRDPVVVTATRALTPAGTMRDAIVITREDLDAAGPLSLAEVLERRVRLRRIMARPNGCTGSR